MERMLRTTGLVLLRHSENELLRRKLASNTEIERDKSQDNTFQSSAMNELRTQSTPLGIVNETLEETIKIYGKRPEPDYHNINEGLYFELRPIVVLANTRYFSNSLCNFFRCWSNVFRIESI